MYFIIVLFVIALLYFYLTKNDDYFEKRGLPYERPYPLVGNLWRLFLGNMNQFQFFDRYYKMAKPYGIGGMFQSNKPAYVIADPELIKNITIKDFEHFMNHVDFGGPDDAIAKSLVGLKDNKWRDVRATLSPAFTGNKMRIMFELIEKCALKLDKYLVGKTEKGQLFKVEVKNLINRFTNDAIATTAFGIDVNSIDYPKNEFYLMGKDFVDFNSGLRWLKIALAFITPTLSKLLFREGIIASKPLNFFKNIFMENINSRRKQKIIRPDMIHLMLEATKEEREKRKHSEVLTDDLMLAQANIFFLAGFESISSTVTFALHHLAQYPDIQEKLFVEIKNVLRENDGKINYDVLMKMPYLEMFLNESQRIQPGFPSTDRLCTKRYTIPANGIRPEVIMEPGDMIVFAPYAFHHDPDYFPDPERFDPERFSEENKSSINSYAFMPFGSGPRLCIANRFAKMEVKLVLFHIIKNLKVEFIEETENPINFSNKGTGVNSKNGFWLGFKFRG